MKPPRIRPGRVISLALGAFVFLTGMPRASAQFADRPRAPLPPLTERRVAVLKEFDADHDGRLSAAEREAARKALAMKKLAESGDGNMFKMPPEFMEEFDKNKDGQLDEQEGKFARETMERRFEKMRKDYDSNHDGHLDDVEIASVTQDIEAGKLKGIPKMFVGWGARPPGQPGAGAEPDDLGHDMKVADRNHDGRLSAEESESIRVAWEKRPAPPAANGKATR